MNEQVVLYISAATDLERERDILARAVTEIPVDIGWRIAQSPRKNEPLEKNIILNADIHLLLIGSDIRAPIGLEWTIARQAGHWPILFLKKTDQRTPAALDFIRFIESQAKWQPFKGTTELRQVVLQLLAGFLMDRSYRFRISPVELEALRAWRSELERIDESAKQSMPGGAGDSSVILSRERFVPSEGVLIQPDQEDE